MSPAVIYGMLAGIGILIAGAQFHVMLDALPKRTGWQNLLSIPAAIYDGIFPLDRSPHEAAAVSGMATLAAAAVDRMQPGPKADYDRELSAQGLGNIVCGVIGALPMTGVIVRASANVKAGARTRWSASLHGLWLLLAAVAGAPLLSQIPTSALGAVLVLAGIRLIEVVPIQRLRKYGKMPLVIYGSTIAGIVGLDLLRGVIVGVTLTLVALVYQASRLDVWMEHGPEADRYDLTLVGSATFLRMPAIAAALDQVPPGAVLSLHAERVIDLDHSCLDLLASWDEQQRQNGGRLLVDWDDLRRRFEKPGSSLA